MKCESNTKNAVLAVMIKCVFTGAPNIPFSFQFQTVENINHVLRSLGRQYCLPPTRLFPTWPPLLLSYYHIFFQTGTTSCLIMEIKIQMNVTNRIEKYLLDSLELQELGGTNNMALCINMVREGVCILAKSVL